MKTVKDLVCFSLKIKFSIQIKFNGQYFLFPASGHHVRCQVQPTNFLLFRMEKTDEAGEGSRGLPRIDFDSSHRYHDNHNHKGKLNAFRM